MKSRIPLPEEAGQKLSGSELAKLKHESQERDRRIAASEDVSGGEMFLIRPEKARAAQIKWPEAIPRQVRTAIYLQAILFLLGMVRTAMAADWSRRTASVVVLLILAGIWWSWLLGLWHRRNWVRWLTVITNVFSFGLAILLVFANRTAWMVQGCLQIVLAPAATVMFLLPVARNWYRRISISGSEAT